MNKALVALTLSGVLVWASCGHLKREAIAERSLAGTVLDSSGYLYDPNDTSCDGFPRLKVGTMPGTCLGLVLPRSKAAQLIKPRTILQIPKTKDFFVVDMGGWVDNRGGIYLLTPNKGKYELKLLKGKLNQPHGFSIGPDGLFYIGEKTKISRFNYTQGAITKWQTVVSNLSKTKGYMHPLSQFVFDPRNGDLYINSGSASDHCTVDGKTNYKVCPETEMQGIGAILRIPNQMLKNLSPEGVRFYEITAQGLRNSMAMVIHPSGTLIQGENSRDFPELEEPYEEINVVDLNNPLGLHYGWPYCYNFHATSPEWSFPENKTLPIHKRFKKPLNCEQKNPTGPGDYAPPYALMPPHVSPLHMEYYKGKMFPELQGKLLVTWHGHQPTGQRLVAYDVDELGRPKLTEGLSEGSFGFNQKSAGAVKRKFAPRGGMSSLAPYKEVVTQWNAVKGVRAKGAPVGLTVADDGSIFLVEDRESRVIVRLARSSKTYQDPKADLVDGSLSVDPRIELLAWRSYLKSSPVLEKGYAHVQKELVEKNCIGCHGNMVSNEIATDRFSRMDFFLMSDWIEPGAKDKSKLYGAIAHLPAFTPMPPMDKPQFHGTKAGQELISKVGQWIDGLTSVEKSFKRTTASSSKSILAKPDVTATVCGQVQKGDVLYVDPRAEKKVTDKSKVWSKVYLVPGHTSLIQGKCSYPEDGVFWISDN